MAIVLAFFCLYDPMCRAFSVSWSVEWGRRHDLPRVLEEFCTRFQYQTIRTDGKKQKHGFSLYLETNRILKKHKKDNTVFLETLDKENLQLEPRALGLAASMVLRWFAKVHLMAVNFDDFEKDIIRVLRIFHADQKVTETWKMRLKASDKLVFGGN